jgi:hypothetical protein
VTTAHPPTAHPLATEEYLTQQFFEWEVRGRGWLLWDYPVRLEPPFQPFLAHGAPRAFIRDDGRRPGFFENLAGRFWKATAEAPEEVVLPGIIIPGVWEAPSPDPDEIDALPVELQVGLPPAFTPKRESADQILLALSAARDTVAYEIVGRPETISVRIIARPSDQTFVRQQHEAYFPDIALVETTEGLPNWWMQVPHGYSAVVDFGLSQEFTRPLRPIAGFEVDPLIAVVGALTDVAEGELACLQILFRAVRHPWSSSILRAVTDNDGGAFFRDAPEMLPLARQKVARPLYAVVVRLAAKSGDHQRAWDLIRSMSAGFRRLCDPPSNELIPLTNDDYPDEVHVQDLLLRCSHRSGMILNADELVSLVHLPSASVQSEKLVRNAKKSKAAPGLAQGNEVVIGENSHKGRTVDVSLNASQRLRHTYIIGASGTGKSTLVLNMIVHDIEHGHGVGVLDPHGDLIDAIIERIPDERVNDVVLFDPADEGYPIGFNILTAHSELEKTLLASDLVAVFRRLSTSWGDQMNSVLANAILAFLESDVGGTLLDLRRFLVDATFRRQFLKTVKDPEVVFYFEKEFEMLGGRPQAPVLTRLDTFLRPKPIRYIVAQKHTRLDFRKVIDERKIFLARLSQGAIGEENAYLLGTLLVSKFHQVAISRQELAEEDRPDFFLTIDEFHNFLAPSLAQILSGARKFHMGLILAHQDMLQLWRVDPGIGSATLTNPCTRVCFRVGDMDAKRLESGFASFNGADLQTLGTGDAIARVERSDCDFNLRTKLLAVVEPDIAKSRRERVLAASRAAYARPRAEIEAEITAYWASIRESEPAAPSTARDKPAATPRQPTAAPPPGKPAAATPPPASTPPPRESAPKQTAPASPPESAAKTPPEKVKSPEPTPGRGGREHKYLQNLVKRLAEDRGFRATIEQSILGGTGSVDVSLEKGDQRIACEISITTTSEQEIGNIQKCLAAGYATVVVLSADAKTLRKLQAAAEASLTPETLTSVRFLQPEEFIAYLDELAAAEASGEDTVRGYKVKVNYKPVTEAEAEARRQAISKVVMNRLRRPKPPK